MPPARADSRPVRFSVIIVHRNGPELLLGALASVHAALRTDQDEVLLVDNGSRDDSLARVRSEYPGVRILENDCNNGFARANNQAMAVARGRYLLLLNNDARIPPDLLDRLAAVFVAHADVGVAGTRLVDAAGRPQRSHAPVPTPWDETAPRFLRRRPCALGEHGLVDVESVVGACLAVRREAVDSAGPLDEDFFFYFEETEWCHRMRGRGWRVVVNCDARVVHLRGAATRGLRIGAQVEMLRSRLCFYRKVFPRHVALPLTAWRVLRLLVNTLAGGAATVLTLGRVAQLRRRAVVYGALVCWLLSGAPEHWGLPDKCPRARNGGAAP